MVTSVQILECPHCRREAATPFLASACASVGVEYGLSTDQMILAYLAGFHDRDHADGYHDRLTQARARATRARALTDRR